jgi:hypothetical protein
MGDYVSELNRTLPLNNVILKCNPMMESYDVIPHIIGIRALDL